MRKKFFIEGKEVGLRPIEKNDAALVVSWFNDPEVTHHLFYGRLPKTISEIEKMLEEYIGSFGRDVVFMAVHKETGKTVGFCGFFDIDYQAGHGEIRIVIGERQFWNGLLGMEITAILTHLGFDRLNLNMIHLGTSRPDNRGATKFFESLDYKLQGVKRQVLYRNGQYYNGTTMDILRSEYYPKVCDYYRKRFGAK